MEILSDPTPDMLAMPRFDDGAIYMQELLRRLAEQVVNAVMDARGPTSCAGAASERASQINTNFQKRSSVPSRWDRSPSDARI